MLAVGDRVGGRNGSYVVGAEHARGGFGITYRARREGDAQVVLVKVLRLEGMKSWKAFELFERETKILRNLAHPGIPAYIDDFELGEEGSPTSFGLVQELVEGRDLARVMADGDSLDEEQMLGWLTDILRVLEYLHRLSPPVIHRDVTPKNVIVRPDGRASLVDFGSVQAALRSASTVSSTAAGTFGYAPPEQFVGRANAATDLYGLAMTFLAVSSGLSPELMPFDGARVDVPALYRGDRRMLQLLVSMTEPDPRKRLRDATSALQQLAGIAGLAPEPAGASSELEHVALASTSDTDAYVSLVASRLTDEGFTVLRDGMLGDVRVKIAAHRHASSARSGTATYVYVARDHDVRAAAGAASSAAGSGADGDGLTAFARRAQRAHTRGGSAFGAVLHAGTVVVPIVVMEGAGGGHALDRLRAIEGRGETTLPMIVQLGDAAVHVARVSDSADAQARAYLPYYWWLAVPRLVEKPRVRPPSSVARIGAAVALGATLLFGGAAVYGASQAVTAFNALMIAASPSAGALIVKTYTYGKEPGKSVKAMTLSSAGREVASRELPADGYVCGFDGAHIVYAMPDDTLFRASVAQGEPRAIARLPAGHTHCNALGDRIAFDLGSPKRAYVQEVGAEARQARGTEALDTQPAWFPSGQKLVVAAGRDGARRLVVIDLSSGERTILTQPSESGSEREDIFPSVSPDGRKVLFTRYGRRAAGDEANFNRTTDRVGDLHVVDVATRAVTMLVQDTCGVGPKGFLSDLEVVFNKWTGAEEGCGPYAYHLVTGDMRRLADYEAF